MTDIQTLRRRLAADAMPRSFGDEVQAAVLAPIRTAPTPELILTHRAAHLRAHAGEVAFPGGKRSAEDASLLDTALRESEEEIGVAASSVEVGGCLGVIRTGNQVKVASFVGFIDAGTHARAASAEVAQVFGVPLEFFNADNLKIDEFSYENKLRRLPRFEYRDYDIWGFTANVIYDFCRRYLDAKLELDAVPRRHVRVRDIDD